MLKKSRLIAAVLALSLATLTTAACSSPIAPDHTAGSNSHTAGSNS